MVSPPGLLALANRLMVADDEAEWRCAMGRAYYAAFHAARQRLRQLGFAIRQGDQAHVAVLRRWAYCGHPEICEVGGLLSQLRSKRNIADYDLEESFPQTDAQIGIANATTVLNLTQRKLADLELAKLIAEIRRYERDVLRDVTFGSAN